MANKVNIVITATDKASGKIGKLGGGLKDLGKKAALGIGLVGVAAVGAGVAAIGMAANFQEGMNEVATLTPEAAANIGALKKGVLDLSTELGTNAVESTKALYQAISGTIPAGNAIDFLKIASKAAIAGVTDVKTSVDGLTTVMNGFKSQNISAEKAADIMFATVKAGKTDFAQLSASLFNVSDIAAAANVKFEAVSAALATMTAQGTPTSVATTRLRAAIQGIIVPSKEMKTVLAGMTEEMVKSGKLTGPQAEQYASLKEQMTGAEERGQNLASALKKMAAAGDEGSAEFKILKAHIKANDTAIEDNIEIMEGFVAGMGKTILESEGLEGVLKAVGKAAGGNQSEMRKMVGSTEGLQAVLGLTGANADAFATNLDNMANSSGAADDAFGIMEKGFSQQMKKLKAGFQSIVIQIGSELIPKIQPLVEWLGEKLPAAFGTVKEFIDSTLIPAFATVKDWISDNLIPAFTKVQEWLGEKLTAAVDKVKEWIDGTLIPAFSKVKGFIEGTLIPAFVKVQDWVRDKLIAAFGKVKDFIEGTLIPAFAKVKEWLGDKLTEAFGKVSAWIDSTLIPAFDKVKEWLGEKVPEAFSKLKTIAGELWVSFKSGLEVILPKLKGLWDSFKSGLEVIMPLLRDLARVVIETVWEAFKSFATWLIDNKPVLIAIIAAIGIAILSALGPVSLAVLAIVGMVTLIGWLRDNWSEISAKITEIVEGLRDAISDAWTAVKTKVTEIIEGLHEWITNAWNTIKTKVTEIVQGLRDSISVGV